MEEFPNMSLAWKTASQAIDWTSTASIHHVHVEGRYIIVNDALGVKMEFCQSCTDDRSTELAFLHLGEKLEATVGK